MRKLFSKTKLSQQDGLELPKPIGFEVDEEVAKIPSSLPTYFVVPGVQGLLTVFLQEYYKVSQHFTFFLNESCHFKQWLYFNKKNSVLPMTTHLVSVFVLLGVI